MKSRAIWIVICLIALETVSPSQSKSGDPKATMQILQEWASLQSAWGVPSAQPVQGSALAIVEKSRERSPDGRTVFHYNFKAVGLPIGGSYLMEYWPVGGQVHPFQRVANGLHINRAGMIICGPTQACGDKNQREYPLEVAIPQTGIGEPHRFVLRLEGQTTPWATAQAVPFPLRSASDGCELESIRVTPNGEMFLLRGKGFPPNRDITIGGDSAGETHNSTSHTNADGSFQKFELPFVAGKNSGTITDIVTAGADCHPTISAKWGENSRQIQ